MQPLVKAEINTKKDSINNDSDWADGAWKQDDERWQEGWLKMEDVDYVVNSMKPLSTLLLDVRR